MNKRIWVIIGRIALSFIILYFVFYLVHFAMDKFLFEKKLSGAALDTVRLLSSFIWSFLGGLVTAKLAREGTWLSVIAVAGLTLLFMLLNIPKDGLTFFVLSSIDMVVGILIGGFFVVRGRSLTHE